MKIFRASVVILLVLTLSMSLGCSKKTASKANFADAIDSYFQLHPFEITCKTFPVTVADADLNKGGTEELEALAGAGLVSVTDVKVKKTIPGFFFVPDRVVQLPGKKYDLTELGKKASVASDGGVAFVYGKGEVLEVAQFTEPADEMGAKVSRVSYNYTTTDIPEWAKHPKVAEAFPEVKERMAKTVEGRATMVLTSEGWLHQAMVK